MSISEYHPEFFLGFSTTKKQRVCELEASVLALDLSMHTLEGHQIQPPLDMGKGWGFERSKNLMNVTYQHPPPSHSKVKLTWVWILSQSPTPVHQEYLRREYSPFFMGVCGSAGILRNQWNHFPEPGETWESNCASALPPFLHPKRSRGVIINKNLSPPSGEPGCSCNSARWWVFTL